MNSIISFDLDMTLLDHKNWGIPDSAMKAIELLRERENRIIIATGRDMDNANSVPYRDQIQPDAIIHLNGTKITVGGDIIFEHQFEKGLLERLLTYAEQNHHSVGLTVDGKDYYICPDHITRHDMNLWGMSDRHYQDPWKLMNEKVRTLAYIGDEDGCRDLESHFPELKFPMFAGKQGADIIEQGWSKADGLRHLCDYFGTDIRHTIAFGDSMNDSEILETANIGIAMGNAIEELKKVADYVTTSIEDDGVWNACRHFRLI